MLNIPDEVKIGWRNYSITQGEHRAGDNGGDLYGQIEYEKRQIFLYEKIDADEKSVTLLHEILHGIFFNVISLKKKDKMMNLKMAVMKPKKGKGKPMKGGKKPC